MTLTPCRECGQQVSTEAPSCPHCGVPEPGRLPPERLEPDAKARVRQRRDRKLLAAFLLLFTALAIAGSFAAAWWEESETVVEREAVTRTQRNERTGGQTQSHDWIVPLIQAELDSWDDDTGDGGRWESQTVSWDGRAFVVEIEMRSMTDLRPGDPMPNVTAQDGYLDVAARSVSNLAPSARYVVRLLFNGREVNRRSRQ